MEKLGNLSQKELKKLLLEGGTFVFLNVPKETSFGIDMQEWNVDALFKGVKMIPPGLHFIYYSAVCKLTGAVAPRNGFFHNFKKSEVLVKYWDAKEEDISTTPVTDEEVLRIKNDLLNMDKFLGAYPYDIYSKWLALTEHLTEELVIMLSPTSKILRSALMLMSCDDSHRPRGTSSKGESSKTPDVTATKRRKWYNGKLTNEDSLLPELKPVEGTELRFSKFPEKNYPDGSTPAEITKHALDSTYVLETILKNHKRDEDLIGEIEFAFVAFLVGHSLDAFEHWKNLVALLCSCETAIMTHRNLYDLFVPTLEVQLNEIPENFLTDIVSNSNYIYCKLRCLFRAVNESLVDGRIKTKMTRFKESLTEKYGWDFGRLDEEDEENAPVVVEI